VKASIPAEPEVDTASVNGTPVNSAQLQATVPPRRNLAPPLRIVPRASGRRQWRAVQWLTVGIGVKRWGLLALIGLSLAILGAALFFAYRAVDFSYALINWVHDRTGYLVESEVLGAVMLVGGCVLVAVGLRGTLHAVERTYALASPTKTDFLETAIRKRQLEHGERVVAIGGGTGLSTMLRGLKEYSSNITAVVTMADDGGSSGKLRDDGLLPPGDLRNCIAALAEAEPLMQQLFQHRFEGLGSLKGHSLGNLIVAAMYEIKGDFESAVRETANVLNIRGRVLPSTLDEVRLGARLADGSEIIGQCKVNKAEQIREVFLIPEAPSALPGVVAAIREADVIIIGPGSLYTSIIPNLLVPEIADAIRVSSAPKIYVCNVMTQPNETAHMKASDHVRAIINHTGPGMVTHVLVNNGRVKEEVLERYRQTGADYVVPDEDAISMLGVRPLHGNFVDVTNLVRHNPQKLASAIFRLAAKL